MIHGRKRPRLAVVHDRRFRGEGVIGLVTETAVRSTKDACGDRAIGRRLFCLHCHWHCVDASAGWQWRRHAELRFVTDRRPGLPGALLRTHDGHHADCCEQ
jgi:hypothetical protein